MQSSPRLLQYLVDFVSYVRRHFFLNFSNVEISENSEVLCAIASAPRLLLKVMLGLAGGDWSELLLADSE
jgi:hypothetical protein